MTSDGVGDIVLLPRVLATLLALALICTGRFRLAVYAAQCGIVAVAALATAFEQSSVSLLIVGLAMAGVAVFAPHGLRVLLPEPSIRHRPSKILWSTLLAILCVCGVNRPGIGLGLAAAALGLLSAAFSSGPLGLRVGILALANGTVLATLPMSNMVLRAPVAVVLATLAIVVAFGDPIPSPRRP